MNKLFTKIAGLALGFAMAIGVGAAVGSNDLVTATDATVGSDVTIGNGVYTSAYETGFESATASTTYNSTKTYTKSDCNGASWSAYYGTVSTTDKITGDKSMHMRWYSSAKTSYPHAETTSHIGDVKAFKFNYQVSNTNVNFKVQYGTNGSSWTDIQKVVPKNTNKTEFSHEFSSSISTFYFRVLVCLGTAPTSGNYTFRIDDIVFGKTKTINYDVTKTATNCTIDGPTSINAESDAVFTITPSANYVVPATSITVTRGGSGFADYTYTISNNVGTLTISNDQITGNFAITATGVITHAVTGSITNGSLSPTDRVPDGGEYVGYITPISSSYGRPENSSYVTVIMGGDTVSTDDFDYDPDDGCIYITNVTGDLEISALCPLLVQNYTITVSITNGTHTGDTEILEGETASVTLSANSGYKLPAEITVTGATYTYSEGLVSLSNPTANVVISVTCPPLANYTITVNETGGTHTGPSTIQENGSATLTFTQTSGWGQPNDVTVTGATKSWNKGTGVLTLTNPTTNVTVTYSAIENKLDSITLSASSGSYTLGDAFIMPTVTAHYTVAADKNVTASATFSGYDPYSTGAQAVTISYSEGGVGKTAAYTATVSAASYPDITTWTKVTDASTLSVGDLIIIADSTQNVALSDEQRDSNRGAASITKSNNAITWSTTATHVPQQLTLVSTSGVTDAPAGSFGLSPSSGNYLYAGGSSSNLLKTKTTLDKDGSFVISITNDVATIQATASTNRNLMRSNYTNNPSIFSCYASNSTTGNPLEVYKKITEPSGTPKLIRIVCDPSIDEDTGYKGGDKYIGDKIHTTDFVVKKQMDTSTELETITDFTINGGTEVTLEETSNTITITYGGQTATVVVPASERQAELSSITLKVGKKAKLDGYVEWSGAEWDFTDITVFYDWTDDEFDEEVDLQDLVESGDATISPAKPTLGTTSYTVSYEYMEVEISDGTVTLKEAVVEDYVSSVSWSGKSLANFKAYSGEQLTIDTVNTWTVKAIYKGAGETAARSFGTGANQFTIKVGSKTVNSLPYTWQTEDDGQYIAVVTGGKSKEDHTNAVANICASINAVDHTYETSGTQSIELDLTTATFSPSGTESSGSTATTTISGFTITTNKGYYDPGKSLRVYKDGSFQVTSSHSMTSISYTTASGDKGGLTDDTFSASTSYSTTASAQARIAKITIEFDGTITRTDHYANQAGHFEAQKAVVKYAKAFNEAMNGENVCSGTFENLSTAWATASAAYTTFLSDISSLEETEQTFAKEMLTYATAQWSGNEEAACVEKAMKTYEHVVKTYKLTAFMSEVRPVNPSRFTSIFNIDNSNMASIIVIISMISIAAVGGYFFLRKRKED